MTLPHRSADQLHTSQGRPPVSPGVTPDCGPHWHVSRTGNTPDDELAPTLPGAEVRCQAHVSDYPQTESCYGAAANHYVSPSRLGGHAGDATHSFLRQKKPGAGVDPSRSLIRFVIRIGSADKADKVVSVAFGVDRAAQLFRLHRTWVTRAFTRAGRASPCAECEALWRLAMRISASFWVSKRRTARTDS